MKAGAVAHHLHLEVRKPRHSHPVEELQSLAVVGLALEMQPFVPHKKSIVGVVTAAPLMRVRLSGYFLTEVFL